MNRTFESEKAENRMEKGSWYRYGADCPQEKISPEAVSMINARLFFQSGRSMQRAGVRPWQYVEMEYRRMGLTAPSYIPPLETVEDAEIWMCLDERVNFSMRLREGSLAG